MKKALSTAVAGVILAATAASALEVQSVVGFNGIGSDTTGRYNGVTGRFYFALPHDDLRLVAGLSLSNPIDQQDGAGDDIEFSAEALIGLEFAAPFLGKVEVTTGLTRQSGTVANDTAVAPLTLTKNALYNITKDVQVGLTLDLIEIGLDEDGPGGQYVAILPNIYPVIGATVKF